MKSDEEEKEFRMGKSEHDDPMNCFSARRISITQPEFCTTTVTLLITSFFTVVMDLTNTTLKTFEHEKMRKTGDIFSYKGYSLGTYIP